eukprot:TRINITY_DN12517_c2_g3_i4.p1 TRINITY_DN12517_c2_g3~~TRINITY_DN12517_c2_g3_i4.p1  ORF type:complete len:320 (+),score=68.08 TRINITY_DN12517_c2_g3_i4:186-1145(+)
MASSTDQQLQPAVIEWKHIDKSKFYVLAPLMGVSTRVLLYPTQLVKTRLQVQTRQSLYNGTLDAFRKIIRYEGAAALYKGFMPNLIGVGAGQIYISAYEFLKSKLEPHVESEVGRNLISGFVASVISQTIIVPVNVVSQRMMVHGQTIDPAAPRLPRLKTMDLVRSIRAAEGLAGFYTGYWASVIAFAPSSAVWWTSYGVVRRWQSGYKPMEQGLFTTLYQALGGSFAGVFTAVATNPLDVVRARLQVSSRVGDGMSFMSVFAQLWREEGFRSMYKGVSARMFYMGCNSFFLIGAYETVKRLSLKTNAHLLDGAADPGT